MFLVFFKVLRDLVLDASITMAWYSQPGTPLPGDCPTVPSSAEDSSSPSSSATYADAWRLHVPRRLLSFVLSVIRMRLPERW